VWTTMSHMQRYLNLLFRQLAHRNSNFGNRRVNSNIRTLPSVDVYDSADIRMYIRSVNRVRLQIINILNIFRGTCDRHMLGIRLCLPDDAVLLFERYIGWHAYF